MGSKVTINDTLQLTKEQGFPDALNLETHLKSPYQAQDFENTVFEFKNKSTIRIYQGLPVRNFLVENRDDKWIYWGLVHMLEVTHNHENETTTGKFKIIYLYTPEEMKKAHELIDRRKEMQFFND